MAYPYYQNYPSYPYQPIQPIQPIQTQQPTQQIQNGGFVSVRSENEARNYPVALGNSVTFIDETAPYCYTKTMGFSQLDRPKFEKYRLVKEEQAVEASVSTQNTTQGNDTAYALKSDVEAIYAEIEAIKARFDKPELKKAVRAKKEEADENV